MGVMIGDLMAAAEGDEGRKLGRRRVKAGRSSGEGDPFDKLGAGLSARKGRGPQDDNSVKERGLQGDKGVGERDPLDNRDLVIKPSLRTCGKLPPKLMGELSELDFLRKAMGMGMLVSKPWGDSYRYDFVCDVNQKLWRTQVRSTDHRFGARGYAVHASVYVGKKIVGLTEKDIDVLIGYIASRDIWYVVPVRAFMPRKNLWFYPDGSKKGAMFEKFREAWGIMTGR